MRSTIRTSIDGAGRLVVPKPIREQAGLVCGMALEISYHDGKVEIEPAPRRVRIIKKGSVAVAVPLEASEPLTSEVVRDTRDTIRNREAGSAE